MRARTTLILFVIAAALAAWFFFVERPRDEAALRDWESRTRLTSMRPDEAERLTIYRRADTLRFETQDSHWEMTAPVADLADQSAVIRILVSVSDATIFRNLGAEEDLEPYGLNPPEATIVFENAGGSEILRLDVGGTTVDHSWGYASLAGTDDVLLIATGVRRYLLAAVEDLRNKRVANFDLSVVDSFAVSSPAGSLSWKRRDTNRWFTVSDGDTVAGDRTAVEAILRRVRALRAWGFPDPESTAPFLAVTPYRVDIVRYPPGPPIHLTIAWSDTATGYTQITGEDRVVEVDTAVATIFRQTLLDLRDRRLFHFDPRELERIVLVTPDTTGTIVRAGDRWAHPNPKLEPPEERRVAALFRHLATIRYVSIINESPAAWSQIVTFRVAMYKSGATLMDEVIGVASPTPGRMLVSGRRLGLVVEVDMGDIHQFTTMLRGMNPQAP